MSGAVHPVVHAVGLSTLDLVQRVRDLPVPGQKVQSDSVELLAGGPAANAAIAVARLGGTARLTTVLGGHPLAGLVRGDLEQWGVQVTDALPDRADPPPVSAVSVREADGERTVVAHNALGVSASAEVDLSGAGAVLVDGHHPDIAVRVARRARDLGVPVVLDAGSWKPVLTDLLPLVDVCAASSSFSMPDAVSSTPSTESSMLNAVFNIMNSEFSMRSAVFIRTHGADPVEWATGDDRGEVPVPGIRARDTAGAGDVWHGALALAVARLARVPTAADLPGLITFANRAAAVRVQHEGAAWRAALR